MASGWFSSLGWWEQIEAYDAFNAYRKDPTEVTYDIAVNKALPIIRVVASTQKFKMTYGGDEDDLIAHAAFTITKALPKMIKKPVEKLDNDKKYMRYLFTCVVNAFYREYDILHGKHNKLQRKIQESFDPFSQQNAARNVRRTEALMTLRKLPQQLYSISLGLIRFDTAGKNICAYILKQLIEGREIAKSVLHLMGCKDRNFFIRYCENVLFRAFIQLRSYTPEEEFEYDEEFDLVMDAPLLESVDTEEYEGYREYQDYQDYNEEAAFWPEGEFDE